MKIKRYLKILYIACLGVICIGALFLLAPLVFPRLNVFILRELTIRDPLFAESGPDGELLRLAVGELEEKEREVRSVIPIPEDFHLYPYDFMRLLADTSNTSGRFVEEPTKENGTALLSLLEKSSKEYAAWVQKKAGYLDLIAGANQWPSDQPIVFVNEKAVSFKTVRDDIGLAVENVRALESERKKRSCLLEFNSPACVLYRAGLFMRISGFRFSGAREGPSANHDIPERSPNILSLNILFPDVEHFITGVHGPYEVKTPCFSGSSDAKTEMVVVADIEEPGKKPYRLPKITTDAFYIERTEHLAETRSPYLRFLADRGWEMYYQPEALDYVCSDMGYVLAALSFARGGRGNDLYGLSDALILIAERSLPFFVRYYSVPREGERHYPSLFYLATVRSSYALNFFNFSPAIWRIKKQPRLIDTNTVVKLSDSPVQFTRFSELVERLGREGAESKTAALKPQSWWLEEYEKFLEENIK